MIDNLHAPRYYKRREKNGFWSLMPLNGPYSTDSVMVNEFTYSVLEQIEGGAAAEDIVNGLLSEYSEDEKKVRADVFHALARLGTYGFIDLSGPSEALGILNDGSPLLRACLHPCPIHHLPELAQFMTDASGAGSAAFLYNSLTTEAVLNAGDAAPPEVVFDAERMIEAQSTGGEVYWVYTDDGGKVAGALVTGNYMHMTPVVAVHALAVAGDGEERRDRAVKMLSEVSEALSLFGLNEKLRITSCPSALQRGKNLTVFEDEFDVVLGNSRFKRVATFPREVAGSYDVEYYDRTI
jgi:hypothetical protein